MKISLVSSNEGVVHVRCEGHITLGVGPVKVNPLEQAVGVGCYGYKVLVDLENARTLDSTGIGWLINCHRNFEQAGGKLILHTIPPMVQHVLQLLRLETYLHLAQSEESAKALLSEASA